MAKSRRWTQSNKRKTMMRAHEYCVGMMLVLGGCVAVDDRDPFLEEEDALALEDEELELTDHQHRQAAGGGYGILLFDITGSMNEIRSTGNTRCADAKVMAKGKIDDFFAPDQVNGDGVAIWGFRNDPYWITDDDVVPYSTGYFTDAAAAKAVIDGLSCTGTTPLADALCKALDADGETFTLSPPPTRVTVITDGIENASNGPCSGPSGGTTEFGTWQNKVFMEWFGGSGIMMEARYWLDPELAQQVWAADALAADADAGGAESRVQAMREEIELVADAEGLPTATVDALMGQVGASRSGCDQTCQELQFFSNLAAFSGGTFGIVTDTNTDYPVEGTMDPPTGPVTVGGGVSW